MCFPEPDDCWLNKTLQFLQGHQLLLSCWQHPVPSQGNFIISIHLKFFGCSLRSCDSFHQTCRQLGLISFWLISFLSSIQPKVSILINSTLVALGHAVATLSETLAQQQWTEMIVLDHPLLLRHARVKSFQLSF